MSSHARVNANIILVLDSSEQVLKVRQILTSLKLPAKADVDECYKSVPHPTM